MSGFQGEGAMIFVMDLQKGVVLILVADFHVALFS